MNPQDIQKINAYLYKNNGDTSYGETWSDLQRRLPIEKKRYENIVKRYFGVYDNGLVWRVELAEHLNYDLEIGFRLVLQGKKVNKENLINILMLFDLTLDTIDSEIDTFESIWVKGLVNSLSPFFKIFPFRELDSLYTRYFQTLISLKDQMEAAKSKQTQAYIDKGVDVLGLVLEIIPEVRAAKETFRFFEDNLKTAFAGSSLLADKYLGPQKPDTSKIVRTATFTIVGSDKVGEFVKFSSAGKKFIKSASLINSVSDTLSWDEINQATQNIESIKKSFSTLKKIYEVIKKEIWDAWSVRVDGIQRDLQRAQQLIENDKAQNVALVSELYNFQKEIRYSCPTAWRISS